MTTFVYDALGRLTETDLPGGAKTFTAYDAIGQALSTTDADSNVTHFAYDDAGRRTSTTDAAVPPHVTQFQYDAAGNQTDVIDALNHATHFDYDADNRQIKVTHVAAGTFEETGYDAAGRVVSRTDANGKVTQFGYDALGRLVSVTRDVGGLNLLTQYGYDEVGNRISQTDANGDTTLFAYDALGRRTKRTLPAGQFETFTYDAAGNLSTHTDFNGKTTTFQYDVMNRLAAKLPDASFSAPSVVYSYTPTGKRLSMTDASGTTNYSYDGRDRMTSKVAPEGTLNYSYDAAGNLLSLAATSAATSNTVTANYTYDVLNRLSTVAEANTGTTQYNYDAVGNLASFTEPNGVVNQYTYDTQNRLTNLAANNSSGPLASYTYTLDNAGHRTAVTEKSGRTANYQYDNIYRLTSETIASDPNAINGVVGYSYDNVGNRLQQTSTVTGISAGLFNYDPDDRINTDTYDASGNTLTTAGNPNTNVYDFENRLVQQGAVSIVYDGDGNRVQKSVAGVITNYLVDGGINPTGYSQVVLEDSTATGETQYVYGLERLSERYQGSPSSGTWNVAYYGYDGHGSVRFLTGSAGAVTDTYDYDAFGNLLHITGTTPNVYRFAGEQWDPDLNLYYNRARYLNTPTGRFVTMDSFEGDPQSPTSLHKYMFAGADPIDGFDPSGNQELAETVQGVALDIQLTASRVFNAVRVLALVATAACAAVSAASLGSSILGAPDPTAGLPCSAGAMRLQLQESRAGTTLNSSSGNVLLAVPPNPGVTTSQVRQQGLQVLFLQAQLLSWFPFTSLQSELAQAIVNMSIGLKRFPPIGISGSKQSILTETFPGRRSDFRVDLDNLRGTNLTE